VTAIDVLRVVRAAIAMVLGTLLLGADCQPQGCRYDSQCSAGRICSSGVCVDRSGGGSGMQMGVVCSPGISRACPGGGNQRCNDSGTAWGECSGSMTSPGSACGGTIAAGGQAAPCGCYGFVNPGQVVTANTCFSCRAQAVPCSGSCPAGGLPWTGMCL
jgi:hypothetical protein